MWIKTSGQLTESVFQLTTAISTHALIIGEQSALVDASLDAAHERVFEQLDTCLGTSGTLDYLLLTHGHFDHLGGIPVLRTKYPELQVVGGPQTAELLTRDEFVLECYQKNLAYAEAASVELGIEKEQWCDTVRIDRILGDGDTLELGDDVEVKLIACPGHAEDSVGYFVQADGVLACGEAVGAYNGRDRIFSCFTSDFSVYVESLEKLASLDIRVLCFPHAGAISGEMVPKFFLQARIVADRFRDDVRERIAQGQLIDEIFEAILPEWQTEQISPEGPFADEQRETLRSMIKAAAAV